MSWNFSGSGVALVTPFTAQDTVNYDKLAALIDYHVQHQTDALVIAGTTGEASTLSVEEHKELIRQSVQLAAGKLPIIAGTGSNETPLAIELSLQAQEVGAEALLIVTPYYNKTNTKGLIKHYESIASSVNIPIILYNVPSRTGMNISLEAMVEMSQHERIVGVKEASGDITYATEIARLCGEDFMIISGNDDIVVPILAIGGKGVISVAANILPSEMHQMVRLFQDGDVAAARALQLKYNGLIHSLFFETNPIPIKTAMNLMGWEVGGLRLPLYEMGEIALGRMKKEMQHLGLLQ